jgi:hypothetical protein
MCLPPGTSTAAADRMLNAPTKEDPGPPRRPVIAGADAGEEEHPGGTRVRRPQRRVLHPRTVALQDRSDLGVDLSHLLVPLACHYSGR